MKWLTWVKKLFHCEEGKITVDEPVNSQPPDCLKQWEIKKVKIKEIRLQ